MPLTGLGLDAPGCDYMVSPFANVPFSPTLFGAPTVSFTQTWPSDPAFAGLPIHLQGIHLAPGQNGAGVLTSNGLRLRLDVN